MIKTIAEFRSDASRYICVSHLPGGARLRSLVGLLDSFSTLGM